MIMRIFKRTREPVQHNEVAQQIARYIIRYQTGLADYLNRKTKNWQRKSLHLALLLFILAYGGYCLYLLISALNESSFT
jgi:hypothetical protein